MFPGGMNPKQMKQMMKRMGIRMDELDAEQVIIKCVDKEIIIDEPQVVKTVVQGKDMYQINGEVSERELSVSISISDDDVKMVAEQTGVSESKALKALEEAEGDLAQAILDIKS